MPHTLFLKKEVIDVRYWGRVGYSERTQAITEASKVAKAMDFRTLRALGDFSDAIVYEEGDAQRADYVASVLNGAWAKDSRVALVNLPKELSSPAKLASAVRGPLIQTFANRENAMNWLTELS